MKTEPFTLSSFPRAIIHIDADAFFASCEQSLNPALRGKPVITGRERGIASAVSYEAKALGIRRGMSMREIKAICPDIIYLPSDYETYSLFSRRMFNIVRRYTNVVEEYSIDECFAEITGLRRPLRKSYEEIALSIKQDLDAELGMTFSIGLAPTKVLAKIASKWNKPSGFVPIPGRQIHHFLTQVPVSAVWGIGEQTTRHLYNYDIKTAFDFTNKDEAWVKSHLTKPHQELWQELRGHSILQIETEEKHDYQSISKTKTFTPPSADRSYVLAQLSKNTENACIKARRHGLLAKRVFFLLLTNEFTHTGYEVKLSQATSLPQEIMRVISTHFDLIFDPSTPYRQTGVVLADLQSGDGTQLDLFGDTIKTLSAARVFTAIDALDKKYGKHTVFLGSSFGAIKGKQYRGERADQTKRKTDLFKGEGSRKRLGLPMLGSVT